MDIPNNLLTRELSDCWVNCNYLICLACTIWSSFNRLIGQSFYFLFGLAMFNHSLPMFYLISYFKVIDIVSWLVFLVWGSTYISHISQNALCLMITYYVTYNLINILIMLKESLAMDLVMEIVPVLLSTWVLYLLQINISGDDKSRKIEVPRCMYMSINHINTNMLMWIICF